MLAFIEWTFLALRQVFCSISNNFKKNGSVNDVGFTMLNLSGLVTNYELEFFLNFLILLSFQVLLICICACRLLFFYFCFVGQKY